MALSRIGHDVDRAEFACLIIQEIQEQLLAFMKKHKFERLENFKGHRLQFFTTHADLAKRQAEALAAKKSQHDRQKMFKSDTAWQGEDFVKQTDALARE